MERINAAGLKILKESEGLRLDAYICPAGVLTIGHGTTGPRVSPGLTITEDQANAWLKQDCRKFERDVERLVTVDLNPNEFSALVSFTYNVGEGALERSTLLRLLNQGDRARAADEFPRWNKGGGRVLPGLKIRREKERALFLQPYGEQQQQADRLQEAEYIECIKPSFAKSSHTQSAAMVTPQQILEGASDQAGCKVPIYPGDRFPIRAIVPYKKHYRVTLGHGDREVRLHGRNTWLFWPEHCRLIGEEELNSQPSNLPLPSTANPATLAEQVARVCCDRGYPLDKQEYNIIGIAGLYPCDRSGAYGRSNQPDLWNDSIGILAWSGSEWRFVCLFRGTIEPGAHYTRNPLNPGGCAVLDFGLHEKLWAFGKHRGYEALVQVGVARLMRDRNRNHQRDDAISFEKHRGVNLHSTRPGFNGGSIGKFSAGCCVIRDWDESLAFNRHMKQSPQYKQRPRRNFDGRLLDAAWLV